MPKPHPPILPRCGGSIQPYPKPVCPPGPVRLAASAPPAKARKEATIATQFRHCSGRMHPYKQQVPQRVHPTVHELVAPPPPAVPASKPKPARPAASAPEPKPAKGCLRIPPHYDLAKPGVPWDMPGISTGFDHVGDGAKWRSIAVAEHYKMPWPLWGRGVIDLRPKTKSDMVAGRLLRHARATAVKMIRGERCEHKIGMCRCPYERFFYYQEADSKWKPWLLVLLASTTTREGANMMEASLTLQLEQMELNIDNNINWTTSCDYGGEGPKHDDEAHREHFVYLAVAPLPRLIRPITTAASAQL